MSIKLVLTKMKPENRAENLKIITFTHYLLLQLLNRIEKECTRNNLQCTIKK